MVRIPDNDVIVTVAVTTVCRFRRTADDCPSGILANLTRGGEKAPTKICGVPQIAKRRHTATTFAGGTAKSGLWSSAREYLECFL